MNLSGLALGVTCSLFLLLYIKHEFSYDRYHRNADNIYRIITHVVETDDEYKRPMVQIPLADEIMENYALVENAVRFFSSGRELFRYNNNQFYEERFYYSDSTVFDVFSHNFLHGDAATAMDEPFSIVLTKSMALKYFGLSDPIGETITFIDRDEHYKVTGVIEDVPQNSHFHFDALMTVSSLPAFRQQTNWGRLMVSTYIQLPDGYNPDDFKPKLDEIIVRHVEPIFAKRGIIVEYNLQRITDIHLHSRIQDEEETGGDLTYLWMLSAVALFILLIAAINYLNLNTARAIRRLKEIGIRKVLGSVRLHLLAQFMAEASILVMAAILLSIALLILLLPAFNLVVNKTFNVTDLLDVPILLAVIGIFVTVSILGGAYPALYLSKFSPVQVLKGKIRGHKGAVPVRRGLIFIQFTLSFGILVATIVVFNQLRFMQAKDLGFSKDGILRIAIDDPEMRQSLSAFRSQALQHPDVYSFSSASSSPGENVRKAVVQVEDDDGIMHERGTDWFTADYDFVESLQMKIISGRDFKREILSDTAQAVLVNEAMVRKMNWRDPINKRFQAEGRPPRKVVGVIRDYHQNSLYNEIEPLVILFNKNNYYSFLRINGSRLHTTVSHIRESWNAVFPDKPFEYRFLDEAVNAQYDADRRRSTVLAIFSVVTILISCLGLLGLTAFTIQERAKEISIRKISGAGTLRLIVFLSKELILLVTIGICVAAPPVYLFMNTWLQHFAYRISLSSQIPVFIFSAVGMLVLTLVTVAFHTSKAALANPVTTLRTE